MTAGAADEDGSQQKGRSLADAAGSIESTLTDAVGETLVGLATYEDGEYDVVYRDEAVSEGYTASDIRAIL
jgi:hypothetical protein